MDRSRAAIVVQNREALRVAAASARISTQPGTALEILENSRGDARDLKLIDKVLSSGHKSVIEHQTLSIAMNDVSVLVEQFLIEARLASFTVKSRRYVDFADAGFVVPDALNDVQREVYTAAMRARFDDYQCLMALGVPKEDARFVLPYALRSNFFMTVNARELMQIILAMLGGRGRGYAEIEQLGRQLKNQFDELYPGVLLRESTRPSNTAAPTFPKEIRDGDALEGGAAIAFAPNDPSSILRDALRFSQRIDPGDDTSYNPIVLDARPRELEMLTYGFRIDHISLACLTHFARHRMQSSLIPPVIDALSRGDFVLPPSVKAIPEAEACYRNAFKAQADAARRFLSLGARPEDAAYFAMSGHEIDIMLAMNARELMHFMKLRTCARAQWEIRGVARRMLSLLQRDFPELFNLYGPSCRFGRCPEGKMSCGRPEAPLEGSR